MTVFGMYVRYWARIAAAQRYRPVAWYWGGVSVYWRSRSRWLDRRIGRRQT